MEAKINFKIKYLITDPYLSSKNARDSQTNASLWEELFCVSKMFSRSTPGAFSHAHLPPLADRLTLR